MSLTRRRCSTWSSTDRRAHSEASKVVEISMVGWLTPPMGVSYRRLTEAPPIQCSTVSMQLVTDVSGAARGDGYGDVFVEVSRRGAKRERGGARHLPIPVLPRLRCVPAAIPPARCVPRQLCIVASCGGSDHVVHHGRRLCSPPRCGPPVHRRDRHAPQINARCRWQMSISTTSTLASCPPVRWRFAT